MKARGWGELFVAATVLLAAAQPSSAQSSWASEGPVVHGHHHLNVTDRAAHERFWRDTLGGVPTPWRDVHVFKFPDALVFLTDREPTGGTIGSALNHIGMWVPDTRATLDRVEAAGYRPYTRIDELNIAIAFLTDPWGVNIELTEGLDNY